jgi:hypothetical protein
VLPAVSREVSLSTRPLADCSPLTSTYISQPTRRTRKLSEIATKHSHQQEKSFMKIENKTTKSDLQKETTDSKAKQENKPRRKQFTFLSDHVGCSFVASWAHRLESPTTRDPLAKQK